MRYFLAILACFGILLVHSIINLLMGWNSGGGLIPLIIFIAAYVYTWRGITKKKYLTWKFIWEKIKKTRGFNE